jgi:GntR family transcriptional regulator/MocR family aminotransferase
MFTLPDLLKPNEHSTGILYLDLYEYIKSQIISHELTFNEKLPSKRNLAASLGVSIKTVENAYSQLLIEGYIHSVEKKGYFVSNLEHYPRQKENIKQEFKTRFQQTQYYVNLRSNRNAPEDFPASLWCRIMRETLSEHQEELFDTIPFNGLAELRVAIADHLRKFRGMEVSPDCIIIGSGTEYMYGRLKQVFPAESIAALPNPCSKRLRELFDNHRFMYETIDMNLDTSEPHLRIVQLEEKNCSILHISPAHQYPIGKVMTIQERLKFLEWLNNKEDRYIIEDDYDSEYVLSGHPVPPLYSIDVNDRIIYMNTFSKSVTPSLRISYMILPELLMQKYMDTMSFYSCSVSSFEQYALAKYIQRGHLERFIHRVNRKNAIVRTKLLESLKSLENSGKLQIATQCVGSMLLLVLNTDMPDRKIKEILKEKSIITSMMSEYYADPSVLKEHIIVVNYSGMNEEQIKYLCSVLDSII